MGKGGRDFKAEHVMRVETQTYACKFILFLQQKDLFVLKQKYSIWLFYTIKFQLSSLFGEIKDNTINEKNEPLQTQVQISNREELNEILAADPNLLKDFFQVLLSLIL